MCKVAEFPTRTYEAVRMRRFEPLSAEGEVLRIMAEQNVERSTALWVFHHTARLRARRAGEQS